MSVDKKINYKIQGGVKNYKPSEMVTAPKIAKSSPDTPTAKLAYITPEEEKILIDLNLYGSLNGKPNRGPSGLPSLEGDFGDGYGGYQGGGDYSSAETGNFSGFDGTPKGPELPPGVDPKPSQEALDIRSGAIAAGAGQRVNPGFFDSRHTVNPVEIARAKEYMNRKNALGEYVNPYAKGAWKQTRGGGLGSFISGGGMIGAGIRGLGQMFGLGKKWNEPTYDMSGYNDLGLHADRFPEGFGVPNFESGDGDYDMLGNKINEITGEITSPTGESLGFLPGYPGQKSGITTIPTGDGGSDDYSKLVEQYIVPTESDVELNDGGFEWRFGQNRTPEEKEAIEKAMMEKFSGDEWDWNSFGLGDMDG